MKKLVIITLLLFCSISFYGQNYYSFNWQWGEISAGKRSSSVTVIIVKENGTEEEVLSGNPSQNSRRVLNLNSKIASIILKTSWVGTNLMLNCFNNQTFSYVDDCNFRSSLGCYPSGPSGPSQLGLYVQISSVSIPPQVSQDPICYRENAEIDVRSTCDNLIVDKWYYTLPGESEQYLSGHDGESVLNFNLSELTDTPRNYLGPPIRLRAEYKSYPNAEVRTVTFLNCSPELTSPPTIINPTCSDNNNGSFTVTFDRELDDTKQEKMNLQVYRQVGSIFDGYESKVLTKSDFTIASYTWEPKNLPSGTYKLFWQTKSNNEGFDDISTVPDAYDQSNPFTLTAPPALSVSGTSSPVQCFGGNDGSITVLPNGGTPPYQYSIVGSNVEPVGTLFDGLTTGDYTILIKDKNSCEASSTSITVGERFPTIPDVIGLSALINNPTLINGNNGRIVISVSAGSGSYTNYAWTRNGNPFTPPSGSTNTNIINLYEGVYTIVVTDSNGCSSEIETFTLTDPEPIDISINMTPNTVDCSDTKVNLIASATGGFLNSGGDYTYLWDDGTSGASLTNVGIGTYQVTVSDQGGNSLPKSFQVQGPNPIIATSSVSNVGCKNGNDGAIQLTINGGTGQYTVNWTKLFDNTFNKSGANITDLTAGSYEYTITDQNNCTINNFGTPIEVTEPLIGMEVFEVTASHIDNIVFGGNTGVLEINIINNQGTPLFNWLKNGNPFTSTTGSTDTKLVNLEAGNYSIEIIDIDGCIATLTQPIVITQPDLLEIQDTTITNVSCKDLDDGKITVNVSGGIQPYTYLWTKQSDPLFSRPDDPSIDGLEPGAYIVTITDDSNVEISSGVYNITQPDLLEINSISTTPVLCPEDNTGAIDVSITGGTPPYTILWEDGQTTQDIQNLSVGQYNIMVQDANGCTTDKTIPVINQDNQIQIQDASLTNVSTYQGDDGRIQLQLAGGLQPYTINWIRLSDNTNIGNTTVIDNLIADQYQVSITDANTCTIQKTYQITQPDIVDVTIKPLVCNGECNAEIEIEVNKGNGNFTYQWNTGDTTDKITGLCAGSYTVTIQGFGNKTLVRTYQVTDPQPVNINLGDDQFICLGQTASFSALINDPNASYQWTTQNGFSSNLPQITVDQAGEYTVTVTNGKGCTATSNVVLHQVDAQINAEFLYASQVFTNEKFVIIDVTYPIPDQILWVMPEQATVVTQNQDLIEIYFEKPGEYDIAMISKSGNCQEIFTQKIIVLEKENLDNQTEEELQEQLSSIKEFSIYPNPSDGKFFAKVTLKEQKDISIKVFSLANNTILDQKKQSGKKQYEIPFTLQVPSGVYALILETPYGNHIRKVIVK
ncbi:T9SS type A sorting domain-containing protein [Aquimarina sp. Aq78]|uniref:T9SS type A sorting domain-containing protein n=3 Tax=Aquimarina sp. Aq78 TaxID=1191889 RepID=UPI0020C3107E|nr:T9SS type A sorting domain-containing protein [Aquimarina sp. Aq78]